MKLMEYASDIQDRMDAIKPPGHHDDCLQRGDERWFYRFGRCVCEVLRGPHVYAGIVRHKGTITAWRSNRPIRVTRRENGP